MISRSARGRLWGWGSDSKIPMIGTSFCNAPQGPVCDLHNKAILLDHEKAPMNWPAGTMPTPSNVGPDILFTDTEAVGEP